jgi:formylglycine-generating enzyme required for sulfatase activity
LEFVLIPAGNFMMGSDDGDPAAQDDEKVKKDGKGQKHFVRITEPFYLSDTEVTRGQFRRFVEATHYLTDAERDGQGGWGWYEKEKKFERSTQYSWRDAGFEQTDDHPVVNVSWNDALQFCNWLSEREGRKPYYQIAGNEVTIRDGNGYRLPTEAQWEYACRAGTTTRYWCGDDPEGLAKVGNVADATAKEEFPDWPTIRAPDGFIFTAPVGHFRRNPWDLFDMHGNVWEWCWDGYDSRYYERSPEANPRGPGPEEKASYRVFRGAGWISNPRNCRSANRGGNAPEDRDCLLGFRLALVQSSR